MEVLDDGALVALEGALGGVGVVGVVRGLRGGGGRGGRGAAGEEVGLEDLEARLARANAHLVHLRRVSPFDVNLRTYRDESRVSHKNERTRIHTSTLRHLCRSPRVIVVVSPFAVSLRR